MIILVGLFLFCTAVVIGVAALFALMFGVIVTALWVTKVWAVIAILALLFDIFTSYKGNSKWF